MLKDPEMLLLTSLREKVGQFDGIKSSTGTLNAVCSEFSRLKTVNNACSALFCSSVLGKTTEELIGL